MQPDQARSGLLHFLMRVIRGRPAVAIKSARPSTTPASEPKRRVAACEPNGAVADIRVKLNAVPARDPDQQRPTRHQQARKLAQPERAGRLFVRARARSSSACSNAGSMASRSRCSSPWDFATMRHRAAARVT